MIDLAYIASPSYSGSTLLTFLLNAHPQIATMGELKWGEIDLDTYACSCGALLRECRFWKQVEAALADEGLPFDLARPATDFRCRQRRVSDRIVRARLRGPVFETARSALVAVLPDVRRTWPLVAATNRAVMQAILRLQGGAIFLDASKDPVRLKHLLGTGDYRVRLIHLVRDGRAVLNSSMRNQDLSAESAAREWLRTHVQIERLGRTLPAGHVLRLRYEDLCADVERELGKLCAFLQIGPPAGDIDYRAVDHHILGNRMRLQPTSQIVLDEKWRSTLAPESLKTFERIAGALNCEYGYA